MKELILVEKYRPTKIQDIILPQRIKNQFLDYKETGNFPHLLLTGGAGCGKTTAAKALLNELDCDYITINASLNANMDALRNDIKNFASSVSLFKTGRKFVILDEADGLSTQVQASLRNFMEEYSANCGFILTANYKNKIIEPLQSRLFNIDFSFTKDEKTHMMADFFKRIKFILEEEGITYDKNVVVSFIKHKFPDMRKILNDLQGYAVCGRIDSGILLNDLDENFFVLMEYLKKKEFSSMRKWVAENNHLDTYSIVRKIYDTSNEYLKPNSIPSIILLCHKYLVSATQVADQEINVTSFLTEFMVEAEFK